MPDWEDHNGNLHLSPQATLDWVHQHRQEMKNGKTRYLTDDGLEFSADMTDEELLGVMAKSDEYKGGYDQEQLEKLSNELGLGLKRGGF